MSMYVLTCMWLPGRSGIQGTDPHISSMAIRGYFVLTSDSAAAISDPDAALPPTLADAAALAAGAPLDGLLPEGVAIEARRFRR